MSNVTFFIKSLAIFSSCILIGALNAHAEWCDKQLGVPIEESLRKSKIVFYGRLLDMQPAELPSRTALRLQNGKSYTIIDCTPSNDSLYNPRHDCGLAYKATFYVKHQIVGTPILNNEVTVFSLNKGLNGYQFEYNVEYLVYAWPEQNSNRLWTGLCSRTKPIRYSADDLRYFQANNLPINKELLNMIGN